MQKSFKEWVIYKQESIKKLNKCFPITEDRDIKIQELTLLQSGWVELTKSKLEEILECKLTWAEYDIFFIPFYTSCVKFFCKNHIPENDENPFEFFERSSFDCISSLCFVTGINMDDNKQIIHEAVIAQSLIAMLRNGYEVDISGGKDEKKDNPH